MTPQYERAYRRAQLADDRFQAALEAEYGRAAGDVRYRPARHSARVRKLAAAKKKADEAMHKALAKMRGNPKGRTRFDRCVRAVSRSRSAADPRAVCGAMRARGTLKRGNKSKRYYVKKLPRTHFQGVRYVVAERGGTWEGYTLHLRKADAQKKANELNKEGTHRGFGPGTIFNRGRRNDVPAAQDRYERFHGHPSKELVEVVTPLHVHTALSGMGELRKLVIRQKGARVVIKNFKGAILCQNEKATQLFIEGGDQAVNLADFGIRQPYHEKEVLGECTDVYYFTTKDHLAPQDGGTATYHHKFGRKKPTIVYDVPNRLLEFAGGGYTIPDEGIDQ